MYTRVLISSSFVVFFCFFFFVFLPLVWSGKKKLRSDDREPDRCSKQVQWRSGISTTHLFNTIYNNRIKEVSMELVFGADSICSWLFRAPGRDGWRDGGRFGGAHGSSLLMRVAIGLLLLKLDYFTSHGLSAQAITGSNLSGRERSVW